MIKAIAAPVPALFAAMFIALPGVPAVGAPPTKPGKAAKPVSKPTVKAPLKANAARDWSHYAAVNAQGNVVLGNPAARVKIVEFLSFTCSHCAAFSNESAAELKGQMIRSGSTSLEFRPMVRDTTDLAATLLVRCQGAQGYADTAAAIFAAQSQWLPGAFYYLEHDAPRYAMRDVVDQIKLAAKGSGLVDLMLARGLPQAQIDACLADRVAIDRAVTAADGWRPQIDGTPAFIVNGEKQKPFEWPALAVILRAKGAR